jgi:uncharacterized protein (TIGR02284 family)
VADKQDLRYQLVHDLVAINKERKQGYEKISFENRFFDVELRAKFAILANQSGQNLFELRELMGEPQKDFSMDHPAHGELYRAWVELKVSFEGDDRDSVLIACEYAERAMQAVYQKAIDGGAELNRKTRQLLIHQLKGFHVSSKAIKGQMRIMK